MSSNEPNDPSNNQSTTSITSKSHQQEPSPSPEDISVVRETVFVILLCLTQFLTQASLSQTVVTEKVLGKHFKVDTKPGEMSWFTAAFSLTVGTFILVSGRLGDMYGYKRMYIIAYCVTSVSCVILGFTAYTTSTVFFDVFRSLQGLGFSIAFPNSIALIGHYYPVGLKKILFMCLFGAVAPGGFSVGSPFTALLTDKAWWPWTFWVMAILTFIVAIIAYFIIPENIGNYDERGSFDYLGAITGVTGLILINFAFNQGPNVGWHVPYNYILLIIGILMIGVFFIVEQRVKDPLVPKEVMKGETGLVLACIAAGWSSFGVWIVYTLRELVEVDFQSTYASSFRVAPALVMGFIASGMTAFLIRKVPVSVIMIVSMLAFLTGNILAGTRPVGQIYWAQQFVSFIITPFGMDMSFPAATIVLSHNLPKRQQGLAASLVATFVNYSISIGLGFAGTVELYTTQHMSDGLAKTALGIKNGFRMGMGLAGFGVVVAVFFLVYEHSFRNKHQDEETETENKENVV